MLKNIFHKIVTKVLGEQCKNCNTYGQLQYDNRWVRGWNNLCNQAIGDWGKRCYNCGEIYWDRPIEEYRSILPDWCRAYEDNGKVKEAKNG